MIESSTTKSRTDGIADLKHLFRYNDHSQTIEGIKNKEYHRIFEALFKCAATERKAYLGATKDILKNGAANRLSSCAATFRIVVEASVSKLKSNTVKALLQHIIDILPHPEGDHCDPLVTDYAKAMRAILEHQSHVEHLCERWKSILDFCLDAIRIHYDAIDVSTSITSNGHSSANTLNASMGRATKSFTSQAGNRMPTTSNPCADFVMCVRWLVQAANAPIRKQGSAILSAMTDYLRSAQLVGRGHQDALIAVNSVLARIANNHGDIARIAIQDLVPIIKELWSNKRSTMREEMLTTLIYSEAHIESLMSEAVNVAFRIDVENLLEAILTEYSKRPEKDMLQLDDISIRDHENTRSTSAAMRLSAFSLDSMRSENQWTVLYFVARLSSAFDRFRTQEHKQDLESEPDSPNKKPKWTSSFDDYLRRLSHVSASQRVCYLQVLSFMLSESRCSVESISNVLERLPGLFGDTNPAVLSWAMLCLAGCLYKSNAISPSLAEPWVVIWKTVARSVSVVSSCRAACHLLDKALDVGVVKYASVSSVVDGMFAFIDFNGPVLLCESSLGLWTSLIKSRLSENPSNSKDTIGRILRWLFNKWTPSKYDLVVHSHPLM